MSLRAAQQTGVDLSARAPAPSEAPRSATLLRGTVPGHRLPELLLTIAEQQLTGRLSLAGDLGERQLYFHSGFPVFAQSSQFAERLGAVGVRHGLFSRNDVAKALTLAREQGCELGRALLELGSVDGLRLYALLGAQLREQMATACGPEAVRVRFLLDPHALDYAAVLRLHPMTATAAAVANIPREEQAKLLAMIAQRALVPRPFPRPAHQWLQELGFTGDPNRLLAGQPTITALRSKLLARLPARAQEAFDPSCSRLCLPSSRVSGPAPSTRQVAEGVVLTLLLCRAVELAPGPHTVEGETLPNSAESVLHALESVASTPLPVVPPASRHELDKVGGCLRDYLLRPSDGPLRSAMAVWGPGLEADGDESLNQLLTLYLTLKQEKRPEGVLAVHPEDAQEDIMRAYAQYTEFVATLGRTLDGPMVAVRVAELQGAIDRAARALMPEMAEPPAPAPPTPGSATPGSGAGPQEIPPPPPAAAPPDFDAERTPTEYFESVEAFEQAHSEPPAVSGVAGLKPKLESRAPKTTDALTATVETHIRNHNWDDVVALVEVHASRGPLPPVLSLAQAIALRELQGKRNRRRLPLLLCGLLGAAAGWLIRHLGMPPSDLLQQLF